MRPERRQSGVVTEVHVGVVTHDVVIEVHVGVVTERASCHKGASSQT